MDIGEMVGDVKGGIGDAIRERPHVVAAAAGIVALFLIGLVVITVQTSREDAPAAERAEFRANAPVLVPDPPNVENSYYQYRTTAERWGQGELREFFTAPDDAAMESLEKANDRLADEITEAAP